MNHEIAQRPDQHTGNSTPYSLRKKTFCEGTLVPVRFFAFCKRFDLQSLLLKPILNNKQRLHKKHRPNSP